MTCALWNALWTARKRPVELLVLSVGKSDVSRIRVDKNCHKVIPHGELVRRTSARGRKLHVSDRRESIDATSSVWRDLQFRFRALPDQERNLWAAESDNGAWVVWGGPGDRAARESLQKNFRALAKEAAVHARLTGRGSPVDAWLNHLKLGPFYRPAPPGIFAIDPSERDGGRIDAVCLASAVCCRSLENTGLEEHLRDVLTHNRYKTQFALNIDRLRRECGWSFNGLSKASGIDKGAILRHIHAGSRAKPRTVKAYAEAFSRQLRRIITPDHLLR